MRLAIGQLPREPTFKFRSLPVGYATLTRDYAILPMLPLLQRPNSNTADRHAQRTRGAQRLEDASRGQA